MCENPSAYVLASNVTTSIKGRNFPPDPGDFHLGPGPQAYCPNLAASSAVVSKGTMVFGSGTRSQQEKVYISAAYSNDAKGKDSPGPGLYR